MRRLPVLLLLIPALALGGSKGGGHSPSSSHLSSHSSSSGSHKSYSGGSHSSGASHSTGSHSSTKSTHSTATPHSTTSKKSYSSTPSHSTTTHKFSSHSSTKRDPKQREAFMKSHPCPSTGKKSGACPGYVVDHKQALKHDGADRPSNMQWQTKADAKAKDKWE